MKTAASIVGSAGGKAWVVIFLPWASGGVHALGVFSEWAWWQGHGITTEPWGGCIHCDREHGARVVIAVLLVEASVFHT